MKYHVFLMSLGFKPSDVITVHADLTYTMNKGSFDPIVWTGIDPAAVDRLVATGLWNYDFSGVDNLSDIDIATWNIDVGADWMISDSVSIFTALSYAKWEDEEYVLVDQTGDYFIGNLGLVFTF
jgi:hypothetical protein